MKTPIHLSHNLSREVLAKINNEKDLKRDQERKRFWLRTFRGNIKDWFLVNKIDEDEQEVS